MTSERWELVKNLFESALSVNPAERSTFLKTESAGDEEVYREVVSLLESLEQDQEFLEQPIVAVQGAAPDSRHARAELAGARIGAYELVREIGRGGMGSVYLAVRADNEFKKRVAIKLIRGGMESEFIIRRFRNERQILAHLEHPNIARLIDGGTTSGGLPYFVMEFVEGEPLTQYCRSRAIPLNDRLKIFLEACSAVHYAHRRMIVHRDLKPGNILVRQDGTPKLLDFGIAKLLDPDNSDPMAETMGGFRIVTPAYASPEQMSGEPATVRSDIYGLGIILFELVAGRRPAQKPGEDPLALDDTASTDSGRLLLRQLRAVIHKAVQPDPERRYDSVEALSSDIRACMSGSILPDYSTAAPARAALPPEPGSVAVMPFQLLGIDSTADGYLGLGLADALITKLSNVGRISVRSTSAVTRYAALCDSLAAGLELSVEFVLEGRIQKHNERVRVTVQLIQVRSGKPVWAASFDEQVHDLLRMEDSISEQVAQALVPQLTGEERKQLARAGTGNAKAHEAYLRGRWHWSKGSGESLAQALLAFMQAIAEDPHYARAHAGVADYYVQLGIRGGLPPAESFAAAKQYAATALGIDPSLAEAHASLGFATWAYDGDQAAAAHHFQLAIALNPDYAPAHYWLGLLSSSRARPEMAIACLERACKLDPDQAAYAAGLAWCHYNARRFAQAIECCLHANRALGEVSEVYSVLALSYLSAGQCDKAAEAATRAVTLTGHSTSSSCVLAEIEASSGEFSLARGLLASYENRGDTSYVSGCVLAALHLACRNTGKALDELERARRDRDWWIQWIGVAPGWDPLRGDPRFEKLLTAAPPPPLAPTRASPHSKHPLPQPNRWWLPSAAALLILLAALLGYWNLRPLPAPFQKSSITKLTTGGTAIRSAISPDGRYVAYTSGRDGTVFISVRELNETAAYRIAGPLTGEVRSLEFIRDGKYVAYVVYPLNQPGKAVLYAAPIGGNAIENLMSDVPGPVSISPDGSRIAFYRMNRSKGADDLVVRQTSSGVERPIASQRYPDRFSMDSAPAWSDDGTRLACAVEGSDDRGYRIQLAVLDLNGSRHAVPSPRFEWVGRIAWIEAARGFLVIGQEYDSSFEQIWFVPSRGSGSVRLTNDLNGYRALSVAKNGASLVSVQQQTLTNVYLLGPEGSGDPVQITSGSGRYFDLAWTPGGKIVYASDASGAADLWIMNADGSDRQQLTKGVGRNYSPVMAPDGRAIAFHSNRDGNWNIWWMDLETRATRRLTAGTRDSNWPQFTPDGKLVVYHHTGLNAMFNLWQTQVQGGAPVQITNHLTMHPAVSPKDGRIACWYSADAANPKWQIAVLSPQGGDPLQLFDVPDTVIYDTRLRWTPQSDGITFVDNRMGVSNLWVQPLDGKEARPLTSFDSGTIYSFDWSTGGRLVYSRGMSTSDVVLIRQKD